MRKTVQKRQLKEVFEEATRPLTAQEACELAQRAVPTISISTVYRAINAMMKNGFLNSVKIGNGPLRYERATLHHHHHFVCEHCELVLDIPGHCSTFEEVPFGFIAKRHEVTVYGVCDSCSIIW